VGRRLNSLNRAVDRGSLKGFLYRVRLFLSCAWPRRTQCCAGCPTLNMLLRIPLPGISHTRPAHIYTEPKGRTLRAAPLIITCVTATICIFVWFDSRIFGRFIPYLSHRVQLSTRHRSSLVLSCGSAHAFDTFTTPLAYTKNGYG
jgi:hypothetical protein